MSETVYFGKHKGKSISEVPDGYVKWMVKQKRPNKIFLEEYVNRFGMDSLPDTRYPRRYKKILKNPLTYMGSTVGREYEWLRAEWEDAGGDSSECPFGEDYAGPRLLWENDEWIIYVNVQHGKSNLLSTD